MKINPHTMGNEEKMMKLKSIGAGIMASDFIDEHNGFLALPDDEYEAAKAKHSQIRTRVVGVWREQGGILDSR